MKQYFTINSWLGLSLLNYQMKELKIKLNVYKYAGDTNHPKDLSRKYYYVYDYTIEIKKEGNYRIRCATAATEVIRTTPDGRIMYQTVEENIEMIRRKVGYKPDDSIKHEKH